MEIVLRLNKNELCIDHQEGSIGFTCLTEDGNQIDFSTDEKGWERMKRFIDDDIYEYKQSLKETE